MMENVKARIVTASSGRVILFYIEPDGDDAILHMITAVRGIGQADVKITSSANGIDRHWEKMVENEFRDACQHVETEITNLEGAI